MTKNRQRNWDHLKKPTGLRKEIIIEPVLEHANYPVLDTQGVVAYMENGKLQIYHENKSFSQNKHTFQFYALGYFINRHNV
jgi:hypothetical protein